MSRTILPCRTDLTFYDFEIELEGQAYGFSFNWNERESAWYMDVLDVDGNALLTSRKIVVSFPLWARFKIAGLPPGQLLALDTAGGEQDPGQSELGGRVILCYTPSTELP